MNFVKFCMGKKSRLKINRIVYPDFISKQKTLELSQSGIAFVMGWNLAKS